MIHLHRFAKHPRWGTVGELLIPGNLLYTLEDPWRHNQPERSCIPAGDYAIRRDHTGLHKIYQVLDVPGRSHIELHAGSTHKHTSGCILLGRGYELRVSGWKLLETGLAVSTFLDAMGDRDDTLRITEG